MYMYSIIINLWIQNYTKNILKYITHSEIIDIHNIININTLHFIWCVLSKCLEKQISNSFYS